MEQFLFLVMVPGGPPNLLQEFPRESLGPTKGQCWSHMFCPVTAPARFYLHTATNQLLSKLEIKVQAAIVENGAAIQCALQKNSPKSVKSSGLQATGTVSPVSNVCE